MDIAQPCSTVSLNRPPRSASGYKGCRPESKVVFLKTHKCASSTLQNMLFRNALDNGLNVVLPLTGNYLVGNSLDSSHFLGHFWGRFLGHFLSY